MKRTSLIKKRSKKSGLPPGTLVHIGDTVSDDVEVYLVVYNEEMVEEKEIKDLGELVYPINPSLVHWIHVDGIHRIDIVEKIGATFHLHPLLLEDILNTDQRPKYEEYDNHLFIVLKVLQYRPEEEGLVSEQLCVILGSNYVISFHERKSGVLNAIRSRIINGKGRVRKMGADYLVYGIIDTVVDNYFSINETIGEHIESLDDVLLIRAETSTLQLLHKLKQDILLLRRNIWPLREVLNSMQKNDLSFFSEQTELYLRDVSDHTIHILDTIESFRDMLASMLDMYLSSVSNRMNEVMKVLTVIATIFIPLTFIAGVYGMNFKYMPELEWPWGYFAILGVMGLCGVLMLVYFWKKKWL